ncbi:MAG TPA: heme-binding domain-containing protein [Chitinophagaceae bacterium]|nr:heme-binding domain-containing protein [Chitinophagaceae bacterium]
MKKKILFTLLAIFVIIQFIRPTRNVSSTVSPNDITKVYAVPADVQQVLKVSCNDCHSNNTEYPWYTNIQPIGWWMQAHVNGGKYHLDFSSFATYDAKRQHHKMEEVIEQVKGNHMPLNSYLWIHKEARLSEAQRTLLINWAEQLRQQIAADKDIAEESK